MLTRSLQKIINDYVNKSFNALRFNLLGPDSVSAKALTFSVQKFDPNATLAGNYLAANVMNSIDPTSVDKDTIDKIKTVASNYIDALHQKSIADVTRVIGENIDNLSLQAKQEERSLRDMMREEAGRVILKDISSQLKTQKEKIDSAVETLVNHELHNAQNVGALDGIISLSKSLNIEDPIVYKLGVMDTKRCKYCWALWTMPDQVTPRLYKLSELSGSSGPNWRDPKPSVTPTHVNCRDVLVTLMPGFSFSDSGDVIYIGGDHDEYAKQRAK